ncbi:MAG: ferritin-like domain-containing protein [Usitatibacter sp.]
MTIDYSIDRWVTHVPRRQWVKEETRWDTCGAAIPLAIMEHKALAEVHRLDLSLFVIFEEAALRVSGALTRRAPDADTLNFCAQQTLDEARHLEMFQERLAMASHALGRTPQPVEAIMSPPLRRFLARVYEVVDRGDFIEGLTLMNLIFEGMAHPLYAYEERYWQPVDPFLASLVRSAFADEARHVGYGASLVRHALEKDEARRASVRALCNEATEAMAEVFDYYVRTFVSIFDAVAKRHGDIFGNAELSPGKLIAATPYEEQVRMIQHSMKTEHAMLLARAGLC